MLRLASCLLALTSAILLLSACAPFKFSDDRAAICNQLNSKIVFNGGTSNTRNSEIQGAENSLDQRSYEHYDCGQVSKDPKNN